MPSLSSAMNSKKKQLVRGPDGQLTEQTPEEVQSLAGKAGLTSPPTTPLGAAMIGANPDQAKMAGTKQQKAAALDFAAQQQPGQSLADAVRRSQGNERAEATGQEAASMEKSQDLQALGGLGDRVNDFINAQRSRLAAAAPVEVQTAQQFNGKDVSQLKPLLAQLRQQPDNMSLQLQVNQALGYDINQQLSPQQINNLYESAVESITRGGAGSVDDDLTVDDLIAQGNFGYDKAEIANLLNIQEDEVSAMNVGQLRNQLNQVQADEFRNVQELDQQSLSGELGGAERALARQGAREASRVGTRSSEADIQALEDQIANADEITFGGKTYLVEDLLKDDTISGIISDYMNSAPGSELRRQLEAVEPGLIQFIQKNQTLLQDAAQQLSTGAQQFTDIQSYNKSLVRNLPANLAGIIAPEAGSLQAGKIDPNSKPILAWAVANPQAAQGLQGLSDEDARALAGLSLQDINGLQIGQRGGKWDQYQQDKQVVNDLKRRAATTTNPDEIINMVFGGKFKGSYKDLASQYRGERKMWSLGLPSNFDQFRDLDPNQDGEIEGPDYYKNLYMKQVGDSYSLKDALSGKKPNTTPMAPPQLYDDERNWSDLDKKIYKNLSRALNDGKLTVDEIMEGSKDFNNDELQGLKERLKIASDRYGGGLIQTGSGGIAERLDTRTEKTAATQRSDERKATKAEEARKAAENEKKLAPSKELAKKLEAKLAKMKRNLGSKDPGLKVSVTADGTVKITDKYGRVSASGRNAEDFGYYLGGNN